MSKKAEKPKTGDLIKLTFLDAFGYGSWNTIADVNEGLAHYINVDIIGYYITEDKNFYVLSMGNQDDPNSAPFLHLEFIPKGAVIKRTRLLGEDN